MSLRAWTMSMGGGASLACSLKASWASSQALWRTWGSVRRGARDSRVVVSMSTSWMSFVARKRRGHQIVMARAAERFCRVTRTQRGLVVLQSRKVFSSSPSLSEGESSSSQSREPARSSRWRSSSTTRKVGRSSPRHQTSCFKVPRKSSRTRTHLRASASKNTSIVTSLAFVFDVANRTVTSDALWDHAKNGSPRHLPTDPSSVGRRGFRVTAATVVQGAFSRSALASSSRRA
mmetsp:Transcript_21909/g.70548  ORF Transcript_21909/g.70548 Transcript_21909/m.70548 type:complete len:233 (+) Transcript_21909:67-765(+)